MKLIFASLVMCLGLAQTSYADSGYGQPAYDDQQAGVLSTPTYDSPIGECDGITDEDDLRECQQWRTCIARDAERNRFVFTGSYGKPNSYIVAGAVEKCEAYSPRPATCHVTVCRFGRK